MVYQFPSDGASSSSVIKEIQHASGSDIIPSRNLGSFVTTRHDNDAASTIGTTFYKNQACVEEYSSVSMYQQVCISMIADLWHTQDRETPVGTATTGSSEAVMLAGLAFKRAWQERNSGCDKIPNVIIGSNAHVCVFKFATYFEVEARVVPVTAESNYAFDPRHLQDYIDTQTIGVFLTLGSTYTGHFDPVQDVARLLDAHELRTGISVPIHVDAASGGFVAPFAPEADRLVWDFRIPGVHSINASGHKYGFSSCAIGWLIWRDKSCVPRNLLVESTYLRGTQTEFTLSFSRSGAPVVLQYLNFLRLGKEGYRERIASLLQATEVWSRRLEKTGCFTCVSPIVGPAQERRDDLSTVCRDFSQHASGKPAGLPVVVFSLSEAFRKEYPKVALETVSDVMFRKGFAVPHYGLTGYGTNKEDIDVLRIVLREDSRLEMETVFTHLMETICYLRGNRMEHANGGHL